MSCQENFRPGERGIAGMRVSSDVVSPMQNNTKYAGKLLMLKRNDVCVMFAAADGRQVDFASAKRLAGSVREAPQLCAEGIAASPHQADTKNEQVTLEG